MRYVPAYYRLSDKVGLGGVKLGSILRIGAGFTSARDHLDPEGVAQHPATGAE